VEKNAGIKPKQEGRVARDFRDRLKQPNALSQQMFLCVFGIATV
jgi:hypothetical protein